MGKQKRFQNPPCSFYRNVDGALFVFSVEDYYSFQNLRDWIEELANLSDNFDSIEQAFVGNKCDLPSEVEEEAFSKELQVNQLYFVSAKTGENVMKAFSALLSAVHHRKTKVAEKNCLNKSVTDTGKPSKCICC